MWTDDEKIFIATTALTNMNPENKLDFWQKWYLCQNNKFTHTLKSRRVGYSYINSMRSLIHSAHPKMTKYQNVFVSYNMTDSIEKIKEARNIYMNLPERWQKPLVTDSKTALEFWDEGKKSKSQIISLPNRALRGFGTANPEGGALIDEMPMIREVEQIYTSAIPILARGGTLDVGGTPLCKSGLFYEIQSDLVKYPDFKRLEVPWWYASVLCTDVQGAITYAKHMTTHERVERFGQPILITMFQNLGLNQFQQEFEMKFQDENEAFITLEMIMACTPQDPDMHEYIDISEMLSGKLLTGVCTGTSVNDGLKMEDIWIPAYDPAIHGTLYAGMDLGRTKDASIFTIIGFLNGKKRVLMSYEMKNKEFDEQREFVSIAMASLPIQMLLIDKTGLGTEFGEWAEKKFPTRAKGIHFTNEVKEVMANKVYLSHERLEYVFPMNRKLHADIHCIRKTITAMKFNRYDGHTKDSHADRFWSLALATVAISDDESSKSRFYSGFREKNAPISQQKKIVSSGNRELDALKRQARRGHNARRIR